MATDLHDLEMSLLALPQEIRAELVSVLIESLDSEPVQNYEAAWLQESVRRLEAYDSGKLAIIPGHKAIAEARALVGK